MSATTDIYDAIVDKIEATLTGYFRLPNPYVIGSNSTLQLRKGFGLAVSQGRNTERYITDCHSTWARIFTIVLVKQVTTTQNNTSSREILEKEILDDQNALFKAFEIDSSLGGICIKCYITDDSGVNFIDGENLQFFSIESSLAVEYQENPHA